MKKLLIAFVIATMLVACGSAYNSALKQIELGMSQEQVVSLMGEKYNITQQKDNLNQTIEYVDRYKNHWFFTFVDGRLHKWYKETEQ